MANMFDPENPLVKLYFFYLSILSLKMLVMSVLTGFVRTKYKAYVNPEDAARLKVKPKLDDNVERVRRAHMNDLENITVFFVVGFAYILTNPSLAMATMLFRIFAACRFAHTIVYAIVVIPQPARAIAFGLGYFITIYMAVQSALFFC